MVQAKIALITQLAFFTLGIHAVKAQAPVANSKQIKEQVTNSFGGWNNWNEARYIFYSAVGNNNPALSNSERTFLLDKESGKCRFEGVLNTKEAVVYLFNFKRTEGGKLFINNKEEHAIHSDIEAAIVNQLVKDCKLLFIPVAAAAKHTQITESSSKIINSEKVNIIQVNNLLTLDNKTWQASLTLNNKGQVQQVANPTNQYNLSHGSDIGGGVFLFKSYTHINDPKQSLRFNSIAALTSVDTAKFSTL